MALVVEDGTVISGADSYVSLADAQQYLAGRALQEGVDTTTPINTDITEENLRDGCDYINHYRERFKGVKLQPPAVNMQWPRLGVIIDHWELAEDIIPDCVIHAQIEASVEIASGRPPLETLSTRILKRKVIGPLEYEWDTTTASTREQPSFDYRKVRAFLLPVLKDMYGRTSR